MLSRLICFLLRRHDYRVRGVAGRVFLECYQCGVRSPGWQTGPATVALPDADLRLVLADTVSMPPPAAVKRTTAHQIPPGQASEFRLLLD